MFLKLSFAVQLWYKQSHTLTKMSGEALTRAKPWPNGVVTEREVEVEVEAKGYLCHKVEIL